MKIIFDTTQKHSTDNNVPGVYLNKAIAIVSDLYSLLDGLGELDIVELIRVSFLKNIACPSDLTISFKFILVYNRHSHGQEKIEMVAQWYVGSNEIIWGKVSRIRDDIPDDFIVLGDRKTIRCDNDNLRTIARALMRAISLKMQKVCLGIDKDRESLAKTASKLLSCSK